MLGAHLCGRPAARSAFFTSFSPLPVLMVVTVSLGFIMPCCTAFITPALAVTPAGSPKTPSLRPSMPIVARISSSLTAIHAPFDALTARSAFFGFLGTPTAIESARVFSSAGIRSRFSRAASTNGQQPVDCTPSILGIRSMKPNSYKSWKPLYTPPMVQPSPTETATQSVTDQLSCSAISSATVFLPSVRVGFMPAFLL